MCERIIGHPKRSGVVAEREGKIIGSNFIDEQSVIYGIGPTSVDPDHQNAAVGRLMMRDLLDRAAAHRVPGVRLTRLEH